MQLTSVAPVPAYDRVATQRQLNELAIDLSRHDAQLESMVRSGNTVGSGWGEWFDRTSYELLRGRDAYVSLNPQDGELAARLGVELIDFTQNGGRIASAQERSASLGRGWATALDSTIAVVQEAANRLYGPSHPPVPGGGGPVDGPTVPGPVGDAIAGAIDLVGRSLDTIRTLPADDRGSAATKDARVAAYKLNMEAQGRLEAHFNASDEGLVSALRTADAHLEDANWQLAKKPSPDGRFNGVDIPGAIRDTESALAQLQQLGAA